MNIITQQENRYLESPHLIRDTSTVGQMPFTVKVTIGGGLAFSKQSFSTRLQKRDIAGIELPERPGLRKIVSNSFSL